MEQTAVQQHTPAPPSMNFPVPDVNKALADVRQTNPEAANYLTGYLRDLYQRNVVALGTGDAFALTNGDGEIKAFRQNLCLSAQNHLLVQPTYKGPWVVSAQGYEVWAEAAGATVIFPKTVLVGHEWKPNPHAERDTANRRILAVHARAVAFRFSDKGIPMVSDWTTIFDTPSYRMIDLLAKAKQQPDAFKLLPSEIDPIKEDGKNWAKYPFDESVNVWLDVSHKEVIKWLSQILNREKKAMDFAQTFAKRNALKHLSGLQQAPDSKWNLSVLCWRPTSGNVIKWDATTYANLQDKVDGMLEGGGDHFNGQKIELNAGKENVSDEAGYEVIEANTDPEDQADVPRETPPEAKPEPKAQPQEQPKTSPTPERSPEEKQLFGNLQAAKDMMPEEFEHACTHLGIPVEIPNDSKTATMIMQRINQLVDGGNS